MATLYPAEIYSGCSSPGEREVFQRFRESTNTADWIVLHSLDIANHVKQVSGEADFVIIVPSSGVLCLEVKACRRLRRDGAGWFYGSDQTPDPRGPFRQASEAMHSIRSRFIKRKPEYSNVLFWSAVIFPYLDFKMQSNEWHDWQVIDAEQFRRRPLSVSIEEILKKAGTFLALCDTARWFKPDSVNPTPKQATAIAQELRPSFELFETPKVRQNRWNEEVRKYTEEQFIALDAMHTNPRVFFSGPAGTGKTLVAIECARRAVAEGQRCLFLCFNRLLGRWLQDQLSPLGDLVTVSTFHSFLLTLTGMPPNADGQGAQFWQEQLPEKAIEVLIQGETPIEPFDVLIVDEAQDLLRSAYLDILDLVVRGGLAAGRWRLFGDLEKQAIYAASIKDPLGLLQQRAGAIPVFSFRVNCRNSPRIVTLVHLLGGLSPEYSRVLRPDNGVEPDLRYYKSKAEQESAFVEILESWYKDGITGSEIAVLSPRADKACLAAHVSPEPWRNRLRPRPDATGGHISYTPIHAFKGLEAPAVLVTDIEHLASDTPLDLFYVAITRALHRVSILVHESARSEVINALMRLKPNN
jgi:DNA polymerase III delta prime subunit